MSSVFDETRGTAWEDAVDAVSAALLAEEQIVGIAALRGAADRRRTACQYIAAAIAG
jgi:hypothetical protein